MFSFQGMKTAVPDLDQHRGELLAFAFRLLREEQEALDCVQDAYVAALREGPPPENPRAWLYRVVHNFAINRLRHRSKTPRSTRSSSVPPDCRMEDQEELEMLLAELPGETREFLLLRYTHGLSFEEVAEVVGRPVGTVRVYVGRALSTLQRKIRRT